MAKIPEFGVKAKSFDTYTRFKTDAEKLGVFYQRKFTPYTEDNHRYWSCLWFGKNFKDCWFRGLAMSLSNPYNLQSLVFNLDKDYDKALDHLKQWVEDNKRFLKKTKSK